MINFGEDDNPFAEFYVTVEQDQNLGIDVLYGGGRKNQNQSIIRNLLLSLEDCYHEAIKKIKINRRVMNDGGLTSSIVRRVCLLPGSKIIFEQKGDQGPNAMPSDLVFVVKDKPYQYFYRDNSNIQLKLVLDMH
ncbi:unnamed protein product [Didymodactylos carnosus]|uniref:Chaperone DnaJ C-terminal domain-containing protein n=1 Tax=Didymodactylos carnosus TaxID=1234261 RepID=A0A814GXP2_9BILA|nr:unnamed protein product [Didymodactylos carnosus]CAF1002084.1 unnamed protein product [Didymodactylos carnosus]CAF3682876.1 unnamed protein product [Didymodactylos carnosus]CAF3773455.1 unnamed protein product [Didymodactylos carnosus]